MFGTNSFERLALPSYVTHHILAEVEVFGPDLCHVAAHATEEWTVTDISRSYLDDTEEVVEEFTLTGDAASEPPDIEAEGVEEVFAYEGEFIYRIRRPADSDCICESIEASGSVVRDVTVTQEALQVTFLVADTTVLQQVVDELREQGDCVRLRRLVDSSTEADSDSPRLLDPSVLTDRQAEILEIAYEMGYFKHPRDATAGEVATRLDIATATFTEHLAAAQRNLLGDLLPG